MLVRAERNGYVYVWIASTGEVLSATPYVHITTTKGVDLKTGRLQYIAEKAPGTGRIVRDICPFSAGAKDWQPTAFSPRTGLIYIPHNNMCEDTEGTEVSYIAVRPMSARTSGCMPGPAAIAANTPPGIRSRRNLFSTSRNGFRCGAERLPRRAM